MNSLLRFFFTPFIFFKWRNLEVLLEAIPQDHPVCGDLIVALEECIGLNLFDVPVILKDT